MNVGSVSKLNGLEHSKAYRMSHSMIKPTNELPCDKTYEMSHLVTKPTKWHVRQAKTQISLAIRPVWSESLLSAWRKRSLATHWAHSKVSDQTGWMLRLIWVFAGRTVILLFFSCPGSYKSAHLYLIEVFFIYMKFGSLTTHRMPSEDCSDWRTYRLN